MKAALAIVLIVALAGFAAADNKTTAASLAPQSTSATGAKYWKDPIVAAKANNLTAFAANVEAAGLGKVLGVGDLVATVFAPSNAAFEAFKSSTDPVVQAILGDKAKLVEVLKYHVVPGATIGASRVRQLISAAKGGVLPFKTLQGDRVNATLNGNAILINGVPVLGADVQGGKTMVHTISDVLIPPVLLPTKGDAATPSAGPAKSSAAAVAAGLALALPAALATLL